MSWLGPASSGVYPHTNGAQCFAGGHRHRIPLTTKGLRVARAAWQATGGPFAAGGKMQISRTRGKRFAEKLPSGPVAGDGRAGRARGQEGVARWASRRACGTRAAPPMAGTAHGKRGRSGAFAAAVTGTARARGPALGRAGFDRQRAFAVGVATARPERAALAGALACGCAALRASRPLGNLDGQGCAAVLRDQLGNPWACLPMNTSSVSWPASIMSSACSQTAVVPGSAIAAGTASIRVKAASEARMERPFFTR